MSSFSFGRRGSGEIISALFLYIVDMCCGCYSTVFLWTGNGQINRPTTLMSNGGCMRVKFSDIEFRPHPVCFRDGDIQAHVNGYSIIRTYFSYGGRSGLYEVMDHNGDVHGYLTERDVENMINEPLLLTYQPEVDDDS